MPARKRPESLHGILARTYRWSWDGYHLAVERRDGKDGIPWDVLQHIKNIACGDDVLLVEFYPPEAQLVNHVNRRHLWDIGGYLDGFGGFHMTRESQ